MNKFRKSVMVRFLDALQNVTGCRFNGLSVQVERKSNMLQTQNQR